MSPLHLEIALAVLGLVLLLVESFATKLPRQTLAYAAIAGLSIALVLLLGGFAKAVPADVATFYTADSLAIFYKALALITTIAVVIISMEYAPVISRFMTGDPDRHHEAGLGEFYSLPLFVCVGMMVMASARDLITIFVALELMTVSFYVLVAFMRRSAASLEAGVKYLILGALSTGLLIYGFAWLYGMTGELTLDGISAKLSNWHGDTAGLLLGVVLILAGLGFKVAAVPFQMWVPDVYQGAPTPVTAFLSVGSKASGFIVLSRFVEAITTKGSAIESEVTNLLFIIAGATILFGNLAAIAQTNFKRLLGYSSIAHAGFLVLALACHGTAPNGFTSGGIVAFYLATYLPMTLVCFLIMSAARAQGVNEEIASYRGLARKSPFLGFALMLALASLAGLPLTAGFMGKFLVFFTITLQGAYGSLLIAIIGAATGFFYYFKIILALYSKGDEEMPALKLALPAQIMLGVFLAAIVVVGVYPEIVRQALLK